MNVPRVAMDIHQLPYGRATLYKWTLIRISMDVQHDIRGRPPVSIWTYNVCRARPPVTIWSYSITSTDVHQFLYGRRTLIVWTYNMTSQDVNQFLYGRTTCDRGHPPVSIRMYNIT